MLSLVLTFAACGSPEKPSLGGEEPAEDSLPKGTIVAFGGAEIPAGWTLCDGRSTPTGLVTPDLRGRFIRGTAPGVGLGETGGDEGHQHPGSTTGRAQGSSVGVDQDNDVYPPTSRHTHPVIVEESPHLPPYTGLLFIMKD